MLIGTQSSALQSPSHSLIVSGSNDRPVILWELSSLKYVRQWPELQEQPTAIYANDMQSTSSQPQVKLFLFGALMGSAWQL